jgi:succinate dehydrogenase / fumarate reductase, cytochrome b subunit
MNSETPTTLKTPRPRPLSPHLQVYSWLITSTTSILHRFTGAILSAGMVLFAAWLGILAFAPESYDSFAGFAGSPFGLFILIGFTWAFYYHLSNGIRHLIWDAGYGLRVDQVNITGPLVIASSIILTIITWFFVL